MEVICIYWGGLLKSFPQQGLDPKVRLGILHGRGQSEGVTVGLEGMWGLRCQFHKCQKQNPKNTHPAHLLPGREPQPHWQVGA